MKKEKLQRRLAAYQNLYNAEKANRHQLLELVTNTRKREEQITAVYAEAVVVWGEKQRELEEQVEKLKERLAGKVPVVVVSEDVWRELGQPQTLSEVIGRLGEDDAA